MFRTKTKIALLLVGLLPAVPASAQTNTVIWTQTGTSSSGAAVNAPASASNPVPVSVQSGGGTDNVNIAQVNGATVNVGAGVASIGTQRNAVAQDTTTIAGSAPGIAGSASANVVTVQGIASGTAVTVSGTATTTPGQRTLVTLDIKTVTTGGTAVTAISAGHRTAGGLLCNPIGATINLGVNEIGAASGTTSSGDTTFVVPGQCYTVSPAATAVSVITSDSTHPFSGYGLN